jgi:hypothetical protein
MDLKEIGERIVLARAVLKAGQRFEGSLSEAVNDTMAILGKLEKALGLKTEDDAAPQQAIPQAAAKADDFDDDIPF